jgi:hypothetical protein
MDSSESESDGTQSTVVSSHCGACGEVLPDVDAVIRCGACDALVAAEAGSLEISIGLDASGAIDIGAQLVAPRGRTRRAR